MASNKEKRKETYERKRLDFLGPLILFLMAFSIFSYVFFNQQRDSRLLKKEGVITEGIIISSIYGKYDAFLRDGPGYFSTCEYNVKEKLYHIYLSATEKPIPTGTTLLIKYYPKDPRIRDIVNREKLDEYYK